MYSPTYTFPYPYTTTTDTIDIPTPTTGSLIWKGPINQLDVKGFNTEI